MKEVVRQYARGIGFDHVGFSTAEPLSELKLLRQLREKTKRIAKLVDCLVLCYSAYNCAAEKQRKRQQKTRKVAVVF